jgi:hypothetical protein
LRTNTSRRFPRRVIVPYVAIVALILIATSACSGKGDSAPESTATAATNAKTPAADSCETSPASSPGSDTIFDTLASDASTFGDFSPTFDARVSDDSAGASADLTFEMSLPEPGVSAQAFFFTIPDDWTVRPGCAFPLGETLGTLSWLTTLGLINSACNSAFPIQFVMRNASTDATDTVDFVDDAGNLVDDFEADKDGSGLPDVIEKYPDLLAELFPGRPVVRRTVGLASIARAPVIAQTLLFSPLDELTGQTLVILFQDFPTARKTVSRTVLADQCTPFNLTVTDFGLAQDGDVLRSNPAADEYTFALTAFGLADADDDGVENAMDTCPFDVNVGNQRMSGDGDADQDGLDAACDPNDLESNVDEDGDSSLNRADLCPLVAGLDPSGAQRDADTDQIGDECDVFGNEPEVRDGDASFSSQGVDIVIQ